MVSIRRRLALVVGGIFVLQAVWVFAVPPFRASDEFDHAYRAAGVAHGQWLSDEPAEHGRGTLVDVPPGLVAAASAQCEDLSYTGHDNCHPARTEADGTVAVATGAGNYNPLYYWVVGTTSSVADGVASLYLMRATSALICLGLLGAAAAVTLSQRPGRWELVGLVVGLTPVLVFSTAVPAPNGPEMCAGLLLWTSCLALAAGKRPDLEHRYVAAATLAGVLLGLLRLLGPLWLCLIVVCVAVFAGREALRSLWARSAKGVLLAVGTVSAAVLAGGGWVMVAGNTSADAATNSRPDHLVGLIAEQSLTWILQITAAFPYRNEMAPPVVYPTMLIVVVAGLAIALRKAERGPRAAIALALVLTLTVPAVLTYLTVDSQGLIWQGRYQLPFVVGVMLMCGVVLDRAGWAPVEGGRLAVIALGMVGLVWVVSLHHVITVELGRRATVDSSGWVHPPLWVLVAATMAGFGLLAGAVTARTGDASALPSEDDLVGTLQHRGGQPQVGAAHDPVDP
jgi:predicted membrane protein DUF2142